MTSNLYTATADQLHLRFISNLKELKETSSTYWRKEILRDLYDIQAQAKQLNDLDVLHPLVAAKLKHILGRDLQEYVFLGRHGTKTNQHGSNYLETYCLPGVHPQPTC